MTCRMQTLLRPIGSHWGVRVWAPRTHRILRAAFDTLLHSSRSCCKDTPGSIWDQCICIQATVLQLALAPELLQLLRCLRLHSARWIALQAMSLLTAPSCLKLRASHWWWISWRLQSRNKWPWPIMKYMMLDASHPRISLQAMSMSLLAARSCLNQHASHGWMCWRVRDSWMSLCLLPVFPRFVQLVIERSWLVFQLFGRWFTVAWPSAPHGLVAVIDELLSDRAGLPVYPHGSMGLALDTQLAGAQEIDKSGPFRS